MKKPSIQIMAIKRSTPKHFVKNARIANAILGLGLLLFASQGTFAQGAVTSFKMIEGETGTVAGGAAVRTATAPGTSKWVTPEQEASNRSFVELNATGESVTMTNNTGIAVNGINIRYSIPDDPTGVGITSTINLYVDGVFRQAIQVSSVQSWFYDGTSTNGYSQNPADGNPHQFFDETHVKITGAPVAAGSTIKLQKDADNSAAFYYIDLIEIEAIPAALTQPLNSLSILTYGAITDDPSFDSRPAIQACINAAQTSGKSVWVPPGTYYVKGLFPGLKINVAGLTFAGAGMWYSKLVRIVPIPATGVTGSHFDAMSSTIKDLCLDANSIGYGIANGACGGINQYGSNWLIDRVWISHAGTGAWASGTNGTIQNCRINNTWGDGINLNNLHDFVGINLVAQNNVIRGTGDDGIALNSVAYNGTNTYAMMENGKVLNNTVSTPWWANTMRIAGGRNVEVKNNLFGPSAKGVGIQVAVFGTNGSALESGIIEENTINKGTNHFSTPHKGAIHIGSNTGEQPVGKVHIRNNIINGSFYDGISFSRQTNTWLQNNTINSPLGDGIAAASTAYGAVVLDSNKVTGLTGGHVAINDASSNFAFFSKIVASAFTGRSKDITQGSTAGGGDAGTDIQNITNGSVAWYNGIDLTNMTRFIVRAATASAGGSIEIHIGSATGTLIGTCEVTSTGNYHVWKDFYCNVTATAGVQNVYLKFTKGSGGLMNLESFAFTDAPAGSSLPAAAPDSLTTGSKAGQNLMVTDPVKVHQGISPNGDGQNDVLKIDNIASYPVNTLSIMSRNGAVVFSVKGYNNASRIFDGHNAAGLMLPAGTYYYLLEYQDGKVTRRLTDYIILKY